MPESNRKQIQQYSSREVQVHDRLYEISLELNKTGVTGAQAQALIIEDQKLSAEEENIRQAREPFIQGYTFDFEGMDALFADLAKKNVQLSSIIVSSHAGPTLLRVKPKSAPFLSVSTASRSPGRLTNPPLGLNPKHRLARRNNCNYLC